MLNILEKKNLFKMQNIMQRKCVKTILSPSFIFSSSFLSPCLEEEEFKEAFGYFCNLVRKIRFCSTHSLFWFRMRYEILPNDTASFIRRVQPTTCNVSQFIYLCKMLYMFQTVFPSIIKNSKLHIQRQVFFRPMPDAVWAVLSCW